MNCPSKLTYTIKQGDSLHRLAKRYQTTAERIISLNPGINPKNLTIGSTLTICPGEPVCPSPEKLIALIKEMRLVWSQHVYWTRMVIVGITERMKDLDADVERLLRNPSDVAAVFARYYPQSIAGVIDQLLTEHLQLGAELITAIRDSQTAQADRYNREWYNNADKMANMFSSINPYYHREDIREMFYLHLDLIKRQTALLLEGKYQEAIKVFDTAEAQMLEMADMFTAGIEKQFPRMLA